MNFLKPGVASRYTWTVFLSNSQGAARAGTAPQPEGAGIGEKPTVSEHREQVLDDSKIIQ